MKFRKSEKFTFKSPMSIGFLINNRTDYRGVYNKYHDKHFQYSIVLFNRKDSTFIGDNIKQESYCSCSEYYKYQHIHYKDSSTEGIAVTSTTPIKTIKGILQEFVDYYNCNNSVD